MIQRTFNPLIVNLFLNAPEVRPNIGGEGVLDAAPLLSDHRNICLIHEDGGAMFAWRGPDIYEGHSFFFVRGREAIALGKELMGHMVGKMIWGLTPEHLRHVRWFNRKIGFHSHGLMATPDGMCELFVMR